MDKTTNILKLCRYCGEVLIWEYAKEKRWNGRCLCGVEYFDLEKPERVPLPTDAVLLARVAELDAAIANERGEGKPPCEGWEWEPLESAWVLYTPEGSFCVTRVDYGWTWDADHISSGCPLCPTAREAMCKASEMVKP